MISNRGQVASGKGPGSEEMMETDDFKLRNYSVIGENF